MPQSIKNMCLMKHFDFIILGSGIAGLFYALQVAPHGKVAIITKKYRRESNTNYAQGGIAAVLNPQDSFEKHIQDTLSCGAGLCHPNVVRSIITEGPQAIEELVQIGVHFSHADAKNYDLTREGGHSERRVLHAGDLTGQEIERALLLACSQHSNITFFDHHMGIDLITSHKLKINFQDPNKILGVYVLDAIHRKAQTFVAPVVLLATGGCGKVYQFTSNPDIATGDGLAMAWRAKARVANLEFMQFHPTSLFHPQAKNFLISEALRGEGGVLKNLAGQEFMQDYHPLKSLAPRDIVARAIDAEIKKSGTSHVWLDMTHLPADFISSRFPNIFQKLLSYNIDMTKQPIPVVPAAHYQCGGVITNLQGETDIQNLFACGEVAFTGFHGANRLASNSLLEAVVMAKRAAIISIHCKLDSKLNFLNIPDWDESRFKDPEEKVLIHQDWSDIRKLMWNYVGIVRSEKRLTMAQKRLANIREEIEEFYWNYKISEDFLELRNLSLVASLMIECALQRKESRGLHYIVDYPEASTNPKDTILSSN